MRTKEAKLINRGISKEMQELKKATDPKYYLNAEAVMGDINSAFTSATAGASQGKNSHLKMRAKAMRAQKEESKTELGSVMEENNAGQTVVEEMNKKHEDIKRKAAQMASKKRR